MFISGASLCAAGEVDQKVLTTEEKKEAITKGFLDLTNSGKSKRHRWRTVWYEVCKRLIRPFIVVGCPRRKSRFGFSVEYDCLTAYPPQRGMHCLGFTTEDTEAFSRMWMGFEVSKRRHCVVGIEAGVFNGLQKADAQKLADYCARRWEVDHYGGPTNKPNIGKENNGMIKLFKEGHAMAIQTDADNEKDFRDQFVNTLAELINREIYKDDWPSALNSFLKSFLEISCKLRGYKADVREVHLLTAGTVNPRSNDVVASFSNAGFRFGPFTADEVAEEEGVAQ